jgi:hypothetical protein
MLKMVPWFVVTEMGITSAEKKNYAGSEEHFTHWNKEKESHFGTEYRKIPLPAAKKGPVRDVGPPIPQILTDGSICNICKLRL